MTTSVPLKSAKFTQISGDVPFFYKDYSPTLFMHSLYEHSFLHSSKNTFVDTIVEIQNRQFLVHSIEKALPIKLCFVLINAFTTFLVVTNR